LCPFGLYVDDRHGGAVGSKPGGDRGADSLRTPGHDGFRYGELARHRVFFLGGSG
jgi:hypothetical protein